MEDAGFGVSYKIPVGLAITPSGCCKGLSRIASSNSIKQLTKYPGFGGSSLLTAKDGSAVTDEKTFVLYYNNISELTKHSGLGVPHHMFSLTTKDGSAVTPSGIGEEIFIL